MNRILIVSLAVILTCGICSTVPASKPSSSIGAAHKLKNASVRSAGYGNDVGDFKSGTYTMTSAGLERKYIIDIPENYNKNKPCRLIFCMHMMGGSMQTMVDNNAYGLKNHAEKDHVPVIFVAPQEYTDHTHSEPVMKRTTFSSPTCLSCSGIS